MLHTPSGVVAPEWQDLATKLVNGDGLGWSGDDRLWLGIGVLEARGKPTGRRLEVWRSNEDGTDSLIGHWLLSEQMRVCYDLARMRAEAPGHVDVITSIDRANAELEAKQSADFLDVMGPVVDHAARLYHDTTGPRNTFYMNGRGGGRA